MELLGVGVDWLTVTLGGRGLEYARSHSEAGEAGYGQRGFRRSEKRLYLGGACWRKWEPTQPAKRWGLEYESWEADGTNGRALAELLADQECKATRLHVAFDFLCPDDVTACTFAQSVRPWAEHHRFTLGVSGQEPVLTWYVGGKQSDRRIRIYRKDLQNGTFAFLHGPVLRIEVDLKSDMAQGLFGVWQQNQDDGLRAAAAHVFSMTGERCLDEVGVIPQVPEAPEVDAAQLVFEFVRQHGSMLDLMRRKGVDLANLVEALMQTRWTKQNWSVHRRRHRKLNNIEAADLERIVIQMIGRSREEEVAGAIGEW